MFCQFLCNKHVNEKKISLSGFRKKKDNLCSSFCFYFLYFILFLFSYYIFLHISLSLFTLDFFRAPELGTRVAQVPEVRPTTRRSRNKPFQHRFRGTTKQN